MKETSNHLKLNFWLLRPRFSLSQSSHNITKIHKLNNTISRNIKHISLSYIYPHCTESTHKVSGAGIDLIISYL